jgi:drug/metabolite transporter (DMT)-like permease
MKMKVARSAEGMAGILMGAGAVLLWSLSSACIVWVGGQLGVWQFLAMVSVLAGLLQFLGYLAMGRRPRALLLPPPRLWLAVAGGFIPYLLLYTTALVTARTETQAAGVNLMNYLWPTLAVLFTTWLVPGERMRGRLAAALGLSLAGVLLANGADLARLEFREHLGPYVLGGMGAVSWALYCALTSRWRRWAKDHASAPLGFLLVGAIAAGVCYRLQAWQPVDGGTWTAVLLTALGPWAGAYMLWEMALHRASGITLGLMAAVIPVLSTVALIGLFALTAPGQVNPMRIVVLIVSAVMIGVAIAVGRSSSVEGKPVAGERLRARLENGD